MKSVTIGSIIAFFTLSACKPVSNVDTNAVVPASSTSSSGVSASITVDRLKPNDSVVSPLTLSGSARGVWYFEASFPVVLLDGHGNPIASAPAQAQSDWMTEDFVPFLVQLTFDRPQTTTGAIVLQKDNPSGNPLYDEHVTIPVLFP